MHSEPPPLRLAARGDGAPFDLLVERIRACRTCPTMEGRRRVFGRANGDPRAPVLFVAEAPGRHGAELTGVPLSRDQSGRRFEALLEAAGWTRGDVFVTNAVLCNPRDALGGNRRPSRDELRACSGHLAAQLDLVPAGLVVALGAVALGALARLEPHGLRLDRDAGRPVAWRGRWLVALYHPSPRAAAHRPFEAQRADFRALRRFVDRGLRELAPEVEAAATGIRL